MQKNTVFVLNKNKEPLDPTNSARARQLLKSKKAVIHKKYPFTIRLKHQVQSSSKQYRLKIDYGSRYTGLAILQDNSVIWLAQLHHRTNVKKLMQDRAMYRRNRRNRKTRYRKPRFLNRKRREGWIPPSIRCRVDNIESWVYRLMKLIPITDISYEFVKFDTQLMQNPEISGVEYQQGTLQGYEVREYLLEKFNRQCAYCEKKDVPLEIEHIYPKSRGGTNRVSNLTIACRECNKEKNNYLLDEWIEILNKKKSNRNQLIIKNINKLLPQLKKTLKDAAILNATRWKVLNVLEATGLKVECGTGALTKMNRINLELPKEHHFDACCVGRSTPDSLIFKTEALLLIKAKGRGSRKRVILNKYGFPRGYYARQKLFFGFMSGDIVKATIPKGKYKGTHEGIVACRKTGSFDIKNMEGQRIAQGVNYKYFQLMQHFDGYVYERREIDLSHSSHS